MQEEDEAITTEYIGTLAAKHRDSQKSKPIDKRKKFEVTDEQRAELARKLGEKRDAASKRKREQEIKTMVDEVKSTLVLPKISEDKPKEVVTPSSEEQSVHVAKSVSAEAKTTPAETKQGSIFKYKYKYKGRKRIIDAEHSVSESESSGEESDSSKDSEEYAQRSRKRSTEKRGRPRKTTIYEGRKLSHSSPPQSSSSQAEVQAQVQQAKPSFIFV